VSNVIYDFWGKMTDRSEIKYEFDGLNATVLVEDQSKSKGHIEISFSRVAQFDFESVVIQSEYPSEIAEKLVETEVPRNFLGKVKPEAQALFQEGLKQYAVFFQDIGILKVVACSVEVKPAS